MIIRDFNSSYKIYNLLYHVFVFVDDFIISIVKHITSNYIEISTSYVWQLIFLVNVQVGPEELSGDAKRGRILPGGLAPIGER